jgi:coiled-coil and C2 domain-containing protein 1
MDDAADLTGDLSQYQTDIHVPLKHEQPTTTLDSLLQVKNEFNQKLEEASAKDDNGKKRRYQRQLKQFEDAIRATSEGKNFNYAELVMPPGFAPIPLRDGRPILSTGKSAPTTSKPVIKQPHLLQEPVQVSNKQQQEEDEDQASDDLLKYLENEIGDDDDLNDADIDPEEEKFNKLIHDASRHIPKNLPKAPKQPENEDDDEYLHKELDSQVKMLKIPKNAQPVKISPNKRDPVFTDRSIQNVQLPQVAVSGNSVRRVQNKELTIILERQRLFKEAALKAKQDGNQKVALVYLRHAKGFDQMIIAAENGLPLDMNNLPVPPQLESKVVSSHSNSTSSLTRAIVDMPPIEGDRKTVYKHLQDDLMEQIKLATANFKHFTSMGDVNNASKFNQIARESIQDLESLKNAHAHGQSLPLYHYERRSYQTIDCNSDLTDNDLELTIIRAINLPLPKDFTAEDMKTYVKFEFPYPPDQAQSDKTNKQNGTLNPEYNQVFKLQIQRKQTKFQRLMNRKDLKLEIYYKAGLLKSDKLLATSLVKLQSLENSSTIHDAFDLLEGRRQIGGKLEIQIRIREPILHKEVKHVEHKWLIIDKFEQKSNF